MAACYMYITPPGLSSYGHARHHSTSRTGFTGPLAFLYWQVHAYIVGRAKAAMAATPTAHLAPGHLSWRREKHYNTGCTIFCSIFAVQVRAYIVGQAGYCLAKAATIAVRYSALRRQGFAPEDGASAAGAELQVLDYTVQMHRLLPLVATSYAFHCAGRAMQLRLKQLVS